MTLKSYVSELSKKAKAFSVESLIKTNTDKGDEDEGESVRKHQKNDECIKILNLQRKPSDSNDKVKIKTEKPLKECNNIMIELCSNELWEKFNEIGTEMIITKAGRRMFPTLKVRFHGLSMSATYIVYMDIIPVGETRYRYIYHSSQWMAAGPCDIYPTNNIYIHPDSPATGQLWTSQGHISFDKIKLTNNKRPIVRGQISLHSMHKYQPRIHILEVTGDDSLNLNSTNDMMSYIQTHNDRAATFTFKQTTFITVTAYQNQEITKLKIQSNPFAKGFRETSRPREEKIAKISMYRPYFPMPPKGEEPLQLHRPNSLYPLESNSNFCGMPSWSETVQKVPLKFVIPPVEWRETQKLGINEEENNE